MLSLMSNQYWYSLMPNVYDEVCIYSRDSGCAEISIDIVNNAIYGRMVISLVSKCDAKVDTH